MWGNRAKVLGEVFTLQRGFDITKKEQTDGPYPVVSSGGVASYHNAYKVKGPGVVIGRKGTLGKVFYLDDAYWPHDTTLWIKDFKGNYPKFLYYFLKELPLERLDSGSANPTLNRKFVHLIESYIPNEDSQKCIADFLSRLDKKIELNNKINSKLESIAKLIYDYWFVQYDFPDPSGKPYKSSGGKMVYNEELKREIPEGWGVSLFGTYNIVKKGELITRKTSSDGKVKVVAAGINYSYYHSTPNYKKNTITLSGSGASAGFVNFWREPIFASDCITVRGNTDAETLLALHHLKLIQGYIFKQARGSAQPHVYPNDISQLKYILPPKNLVERYGNTVLDANEKISVNERENENLVELRDWLLPMLMNGQVRVKS